MLGDWGFYVSKHTKHLMNDLNPGFINNTLKLKINGREVRDNAH